MEFGNDKALQLDLADENDQKVLMWLKVYSRHPATIEAAEALQAATIQDKDAPLAAALPTLHAIHAAWVGTLSLSDREELEKSQALGPEPRIADYYNTIGQEGLLVLSPSSLFLLVAGVEVNLTQESVDRQIMRYQEDIEASRQGLDPLYPVVMSLIRAMPALSDFLSTEGRTPDPHIHEEILANYIEDVHKMRTCATLARGVLGIL